MMSRRRRISHLVGSEFGEFQENTLHNRVRRRASTRNYSNARRDVTRDVTLNKMPYDEETGLYLGDDGVDRGFIYFRVDWKKADYK